MKSEAFVVDTNVLVSAVLFPGSKPSQALAIARKRGCLLMDKATAMELLEVLSRPKFDRYVDANDRMAFIRKVVSSSLVPVVEERIQVCRDPDDDAILELAVAGSAEAIITGDIDLLVLDPFRGIRIVTPDQFVASSLPAEDQ